MKNVIQLRRVHELEPHVMPDAPVRPIHLRIAMAFVRVRMIASDFVDFWSLAPLRKKLAPYIAQAREFIEVFRLYAKHHNPIYAARMAYGIVIKQLPF